jgi:4-amino-4-deoxy-L-arabinose transferase-like glycosyltransferase
LQPSALAKRLFLLLFIIIILFYFFGLGYLPLVGPDEPRYAQVAREMLLRGDFVTPTLGGHTWFEKPALLYWMMIAAYKLFGVGELSARVGPAMCGMLTILAVWVVTRQMERGHPDELRGLSLWSATAIATSLGMIVFSRGASFDVVVTMTITWALVFFLLHELATSAKNRRLLLAAFYAVMGLSLLAKGLIGVVIPFGVIGLYQLLAHKRPTRDLWLSLLWGLPITLLVSATWYGPVITQHGWTFIDEFFVQHHFARYVSDKYHHPQPIYFYLPILLMLTMPWTALFIDSLANLRFPGEAKSQPSGQLKLLAASWILFPLLFFSFSGSKLPGYILPAIPAAAILIGERIMQLASKKSARWPVITTGILAVFLAVAGVCYTKWVSVPSLPTAVLITLPILIAGLFAIIFARYVTFAVLFVAISTVLTLGAILRFAASDFAQHQSVREMLAVADRRGLSNAPVFIRRGSDRTAEFYANGRVVYGADGEPERLEELPEMISEAKRRGQKILILIPVEYLEPYKKSADVEIIADNGNLALLATKNQ